jgi:hypothetical protein
VIALQERVGCAQCGCPAPTGLSELLLWRHGDLAASGEVDDVTAAMVLCPDCDDESRRGEYDAGAGD